MITLKLISKGGKIATSYNEKDVTIIDIALLKFEFDRIYKELMCKEYDSDFEVKDDEKK